jgi:hypothetical protein
MAIEQPHGDVITILLEQHRRIRELFTHVKRAEDRRQGRPRRQRGQATRGRQQDRGDCRAIVTLRTMTSEG